MRRGRRGPSGVTITEVVASLLVLGVAMSITLEAFGWALAERKAVASRELALREAANRMERLTARPFGELTSETVKDVPLSETARNGLPGGSLKVVVEPVDEDGRPPAKRIRVEVRWKGAGDRDEAPVRLTAWVHEVRP